MSKFLKTYWVILIILIIGIFLRGIDIGKNSLYGDELTITLDANSLLKTGHDQLGNFLPLTFPMGAGRPAGYVYGSVPFVALFGPSALGVRALSILSGLGIIILLYCIGKKLFSEKVGLIAALLISVSPWDISLSRGGFEAHFALFLSLLGLYLFIKAKERPLFYIFSALSFGITLHTYPTYKVILPLYLVLLLRFQGIKDTLINKGRRYFLFACIILLILGGLSLSQTFIGGSETRFSDINIFSQGKLKDSIEQKIDLERSITKLPQTFSKYFHNKGVEYTKVWIENYLQNFSIDFLVLHGDRNPRHNMATMGELYFVDIFLILVALLSFWTKYRKTILCLLFWILLSPIPTAIVDLPHGLRSSFMLPPLIILASLGLSVLISNRNKVLLTLIGFLFIIQFTFFIQKLYFLAPSEYSNFWSYSGKVASELAIQNKEIYKYIIISDQIDAIEFAYPVYSNADPALVIAQNRNATRIGEYKFKRYGNVYIGNIPSEKLDAFVKGLNTSTLFIGAPNVKNVLTNFEIINGLDNIPILIVKKSFE